MIIWGVFALQLHITVKIRAMALHRSFFRPTSQVRVHANRPIETPIFPVRNRTPTDVADIAMANLKVPFELPKTFSVMGTNPDRHHVHIRCLTAWGVLSLCEFLDLCEWDHPRTKVTSYRSGIPFSPYIHQARWVNIEASMGCSMTHS